jgi:hypothetical protein
MARPPETVEVKVDLKLLSVSGVWEPNDSTAPRRGNSTSS